MVVSYVSCWKYDNSDENGCATDRHECNIRLSVFVRDLGFEHYLLIVSYWFFVAKLASAYWLLVCDYTVESQ